KSPDGNGNGSPSKPPATPKKSTAVVDLFRDAVNRVARRVTFDAKNAAKKPQKFQTWIEGKAQEHRSVFVDAILPTMRVVHHPQEEGAAVAAISLEGRFFGRLLDLLAPLVDGPASELQ